TRYVRGAGPKLRPLGIRVAPTTKSRWFFPAWCGHLRGTSPRRSEGDLGTHTKNQGTAVRRIKRGGRVQSRGRKIDLLRRALEMGVGARLARRGEGAEFQRHAKPHGTMGGASGMTRF